MILQYIQRSEDFVHSRFVCMGGHLLLFLFGDSFLGFCYLLGECEEFLTVGIALLGSVHYLCDELVEPDFIGCEAVVITATVVHSDVSLQIFDSELASVIVDDLLDCFDYCSMEDCFLDGR